MTHVRKDTDTLVRNTIAEIRNTTAATLYLAFKRQGKPVTQQEFADVIGITRTRFNQIVASLECKKTS